jgi:hypothetical protein
MRHGRQLTARLTLAVWGVAAGEKPNRMKLETNRLYTLNLTEKIYKFL